MESYYRQDFLTAPTERIFYAAIIWLCAFLLINIVCATSANAQVLELESSSVTAKRDQPEVSVFVQRSKVDIGLSPMPPSNNIEKIKEAVIKMDIFDVNKKFDQQ